MAATPIKTNEVLAGARKDLEAQLAVVREEIARLAAEEQALAHAVSSLDGGNPATSAGGRVSKRAVQSDKKRSGRSSTRKASAGRRRRPRAANKATADRVNELQGLLADGPKSRTDLAAALKVSPARVQQLLGELGGSVSSQPDPAQRRGKLWSLAGSGKSTTSKKSPVSATGSAKRASRSSARRAPAKK